MIDDLAPLPLLACTQALLVPLVQEVVLTVPHRRHDPAIHTAMVAAVVGRVSAETLNDMRQCLNHCDHSVMLQQVSGCEGVDRRGFKLLVSSGSDCITRSNFWAAVELWPGC